MPKIPLNPRLVLGSVFLGLSLPVIGYLASGAAHADPTLLIPGHTDNDGSFYVGELERTNQLPADFRVVGYPADIWPLEPLTMDAATSIGADNAVAIFDGLPDWQKGAVTCRGFSEGTASCLKMAQQRPVHVVLDADPYGSTALFRNPMFRNDVVEPIVRDGFGIPTDLPVPPGTERNYSVGDIVANGGPQDIPGGVAQLINMNDHSIQDPSEPHVDWVDDEGVLNHTYDVGSIPGVNDGIPGE